jgi:hypothetical protein
MKNAKVTVRDVILICSHCPDIAVKERRSYYLFAVYFATLSVFKTKYLYRNEKIHENLMQYSQYTDREMKPEPIYYGAAVLSVPYTGYSVPNF